MPDAPTIAPSILSAVCRDAARQIVNDPAADVHAVIDQAVADAWMLDDLDRLSGQREEGE